MKRISMYHDGKRFIARSECQGRCGRCVTHKFRKAYDTLVSVKVSHGAPLRHRFGEATGVIVLTLMSIGMSLTFTLAVYMYRQRMKRNFYVTLDANVALIIGLICLWCTNLLYMFHPVVVCCIFRRFALGEWDIFRNYKGH